MFTIEVDEVTAAEIAEITKFTGDPPTVIAERAIGNYHVKVLTQRKGLAEDDPNELAAQVEEYYED